MSVIAVLGSGRVGSTLGKAWAAKGHKIIFTSRDPSQDKIKELVAQVPGSRAAGITEGLKEAQVVLVAIPWQAVNDAIPKVAEDLAGKVVIDVVVPLKAFPSELAIGTTTSAGEVLQSLAPKAHVVKAFSTMGTDVMKNPDFGNGNRVTTFIAGNDAAAKETVKKLAVDAGFSVVDAGDLKISRLLEPTGCLWIHLAYGAKIGGPMGGNLAINALQRAEKK